VDGIRQIDLFDTPYGDLKFTLPVPRAGEPWGVMLPLKETPWAKLIPIVTGDALSHALHGNTKPLMSVVGRPPRHQGKQLQVHERHCKLLGTCTLHEYSRCYVGSGDLPGCYVAPLLGPEAAMLALVVAMAWNEGRYVVVVEGGEFVL